MTEYEELQAEGLTPDDIHERFPQLTSSEVIAIFMMLDPEIMEAVFDDETLLDRCLR